jgi:hypothetical protein
MIAGRDTRRYAGLGDNEVEGEELSLRHMVVVMSPGSSRCQDLCIWNVVAHWQLMLIGENRDGFCGMALAGRRFSD